MTYTPPTVAPPARLPWVVEDVASAALDVLRLDPADEDAARIADDADRATRRVDFLQDYEVAPATVDPIEFGVAVDLTVELYRGKDAPFGVTDAWSVDGASIRISADVDKRARLALSRMRSRWGIG